MKCPFCKKENAPGATVCQKCFALLPVSKVSKDEKRVESRSGDHKEVSE